MAVQAASVLEVIPSVQLQRPVDAPVWVAGVFRFRGVVTPVIDLHHLSTGIACPARLSTRIVLIEYPTLDGPRPLGLLAEQVTDLRPLVVTGSKYSPGTPGDGPDLGPMVADAEGVVRLPTVGRLIPSAFRSALFAEGGA